MGKKKVSNNLFCRFLSGLLCVTLVVVGVVPAAPVSASELHTDYVQMNVDETADVQENSIDLSESDGADADGGKTDAGETQTPDNGMSGDKADADTSDDGTDGEKKESPDAGDGTGLPDAGNDEEVTESPDDESGEEGIENPDGETGEEDELEAEEVDEEADTELGEAEISYDSGVSTYATKSDATTLYNKFDPKTDIAHGMFSSGTMAWLIDGNGKLTVAGTGELERGYGPNGMVPRWYLYNANIESAEIKISGIKDLSYMFYYTNIGSATLLSGFDSSQATNMSYMFANCPMSSMTNASYMKTNNVTNMSYMFYNCPINTLDLSSFNTSKVEDMSYMFYRCSSLRSLDVSTFNTAKVTTMDYMFYGCSSLSPLNVSSFNTSQVTTMEYMFGGCSGLKELDLGSFVTSNVKSMRAMFYGCSGLQTLDLSKLDTQNVTNMSSMFASCRGLQTLDLSKLNTSNVTTMSGMFSGCSGLTELDLRSLNTGNVKDMGSLLSSCTKLQTVYLSGLNTSNVTNMASMFYGCSSLQTVYLSGLDTGNVTNMSSMFASCTGLQTLDLSALNTPSVINMSSMFNNCTGLQTLKLSNDFVTDQVTTMASMFNNCRSLQTLDLSSFQTGRVTTMANMFSNCKSLETLDVSNFVTNNVSYMDFMFYNCESLLTLDLSSFVTGKVSSMKYMFYSCRSLTDLDMSNFDTSRVTDMGYMFNNCSSLLSLDLSAFNTSAVQYMVGMFSGCSSMKELKLDTEKFDTGKVLVMSYMFDNCSSLESVDLSGFEPKNVKSYTYVCISGDAFSQSTRYFGGMEYMFNNCSSLTDLRIDAEKFDTSNVINMEGMFSGCSRLEGVDVSGFKTGNVTNMNSMFKGCNSLKSTGGSTHIKFDLSSFDTSKVTDMSEMFSRCNSLTSLDLTSFDTGSVTNMQSMFFLCIDMVDLDISNFDTSNVTDIHDMFYSCRNLQELDMSSFDASNVENVWSMLSECVALKIIHTPRNLTIAATLPKDQPDDAWYQSGKYNNVLTVLPQNLSKSIMLIKNKEFEYPCIIVQKAKTSYNRGEALSLDDLEVTYYDESGNPTVIEEGYTTNADEIDMLTSDSADLIVTYVKDGREFSDSVELTISGKLKVNISGIDIESITYNTKSVSYYGEIEVTRDTDGVLVPYEDLTLMFGYGGRLSDGTVYPYTESGKPPVDAGVYYLRVSVSEDNKYYTGDLIIAFDINPAPVTITADSFIVSANTELPEEYTYTVDGLLNGKTLDKEPVITCDADITTPGDYDIVLSGADAGNNYIITYVNGTLAVTTKKIVDISGITTNNTIYNAKPYSFSGQPTVTILNTGEVLTGNGVNFIYSYSGTLADGVTPYMSTNPPVNAGDYRLTVEVADYDDNYIGSSNYSFKILKAPVRISAKDITLNVGDKLPEKYEYEVSGLLGGKILNVEPVLTCNAVDTSQEGIYEIVPSGADAGYNYEIIYYNGTLTIKKDGDTELEVEDIPRQIFTGKQIKPEVRVYASDGITLLKKGKDYNIKYYNNINADTSYESGRKIGISRDGSADNGFTKGMAYVVVTGKGNYSGTVYRNFYIDPRAISEDGENLADGFALKCKDQLVPSSKAQKPFQSIKYKKSMKVNEDYNISLTALNALDYNNEAIEQGETISEGTDITVPAYFSGTFELTIEGIGNYKGTLTQTIYVADKAHLLKNSKITLGKNLKSVKYMAEGVSLTPAYYETAGKTYYVTDEDGERITANKEDVFTVRIGNNYLEYGEDKDFVISYKDNDRVGIATMTITGRGEYVGTKSIRFSVKGSAFNAKTVTIDNFQPSMSYTGTERTQNDVRLICSGDSDTKEFVLGEHYTIEYKNCLNKGTATMIFKARPESGFSGSFKKSYKIEAAELMDAVTVVAADGSGDGVKKSGKDVYQIEEKTPYTKAGVKPADKICLMMDVEGSDPIKLTENEDYTISYKDNKSFLSLPEMIIKGKGNYKGNLIVSFTIAKAQLEGNTNLTATVSPVAYNEKKGADYKYEPKIKMIDGKTGMVQNKDYTVKYYRNSQTDVDAYLTAKLNNESEKVLQELRPYAVIAAVTGSEYEGSMEVDLTVYRTKLTKKNLYVIINDPDQTIYNGEHLEPEVTVYYGDTKSIKEAAKAEVTRELTLTDSEGKYKLTKLQLKNDQINGDYTLTYGDNIKAGKNKGRITIYGTGLYGGGVSMKFTIQSKGVYESKVEPWEEITDKIKQLFAW